MVIWIKGFAIVFLSVLILAACHKPYYISQRSASSYKVNDVTPDSNLLRLIKPYKDGLDVKMNEIIGYADTKLTKQQPESTLGNFMADAQLQAARKIDPAVELSVGNQGGIRLQVLAEGEISMRKMYELIPFDNTLTIIEMPGSVLQKFCDHMALANGWPVSGVSYIISNKRAKDVMVNKKPLNRQAVYKVVTNDYLAGGGDNCFFLKELKQHPTNVFVRDAVIDYVKALSAQGKPLHAELQNRVTSDE